MNHNLSLLPQEQRDDIELEKRAAGLIKMVKLGKRNKEYVKGQLAQEKDPAVHEKFKFYLNKYRVMK